MVFQSASETRPNMRVGVRLSWPVGGLPGPRFLGDFVGFLIEI